MVYEFFKPDDETMNKNKKIKHVVKWSPQLAEKMKKNHEENGKEITAIVVDIKKDYSPSLLKSMMDLLNQEDWRNFRFINLFFQEHSLELFEMVKVENKLLDSTGVILSNIYGHIRNSIESVKDLERWFYIAQQEPRAVPNRLKNSEVFKILIAKGMDIYSWLPDDEIDLEVIRLRLERGVGPVGRGRLAIDLGIEKHPELLKLVVLKEGYYLMPFVEQLSDSVFTDDFVETLYMRDERSIKMMMDRKVIDFDKCLELLSKNWRGILDLNVESLPVEKRDKAKLNALMSLENDLL